MATSYTQEALTARLDELQAQLNQQRHAAMDAQAHARQLEQGIHRLEGAVAILRSLLEDVPPAATADAGNGSDPHAEGHP